MVKKGFLLAPKFIGVLTKCGKKDKAEKNFYGILKKIKKRNEVKLTKILRKMVGNARPFVDFIIKKIGATTYDIPVYMTAEREKSKAIRWIVFESCGIKKRQYTRRLYKELLAVYKRKGNVIARKNELHVKAEKHTMFVQYLSKK